jgi:hypothetical protein
VRVLERARADRAFEVGRESAENRLHPTEKMAEQHVARKPRLANEELPSRVNRDSGGVEYDAANLDAPAVRCLPDAAGEVAEPSPARVRHDVAKFALGKPRDDVTANNLPRRLLCNRPSRDQEGEA